MDAVDRAVADAAAGRTQLARRRLQGYLVDRSDDLDARALLAGLYRADGHRDEAGRWGWFGAADPEEVAAYEHQCAHRMTPSWTATSILRGLRWRAPLEDAPPHVREALQDLARRSAEESARWERAAHPLRTVLERLRRWWR
ncbi:hypothetical protein SAMN04488544_2077 [Microlunatus sagamiharensis]|uniref:Uncharacterized protein n=1 Tax=Microlunatus sagamiharensis TaxID=546874 RepID=A0A1H2MHS7_9ACTN|nr:DUF6584 family protein [Microlunatus sagamiharensis]SDU92624.1 hypothetical protein SAMN04488544_2077 [Microlunatus sagamiharensis]